jgi:hypothetical protein
VALARQAGKGVGCLLAPSFLPIQKASSASRAAPESVGIQPPKGPGTSTSWITVFSTTTGGGGGAGFAATPKSGNCRTMRSMSATS